MYNKKVFSIQFGAAKSINTYLLALLLKIVDDYLNLYMDNLKYQHLKLVFRCVHLRISKWVFSIRKTDFNWRYFRVLQQKKYLLNMRQDNSFLPSELPLLKNDIYVKFYL